MSTTIYLSYDVSAESEARVRKTVEREFMTNPQWNGASFSIERAEATSLDTPHSDGEVLFRNVVLPALNAHG